MDEINKSSTPGSPLEEISKWVEEHENLLHRFARYRKISHELAEDLVKINFISTLKDWLPLRRESSAKNWLVNTLRHKIIDHYRRRKTASLKDFSDVGEAITQSAIASEKMVQDPEYIRLNPE